MKIKIPIPSKQWKFKSKSGKEYLVSLMDDNTWDCDCWGFPSRKKKGLDCRHINLIKKYGNKV